MKKWMILITLMLWILPTVLAVDCHISEDNVTFVNIASPVYGGSVDEQTGLIYTQNLQESTNYYFKCRENSTSNWTYYEQRTKSGWEESNLLAVLSVLFVFLGFFLILYFFGDDLNDYMGMTKILRFLKPMYFVFALGTTFVMLWVTGELAADAGMATGVVKVLQYLLIPYGIVCVFIAFALAIGMTTHIMDWKRATKEGRGDDYE